MAPRLSGQPSICGCASFVTNLYWELGTKASEPCWNNDISNVQGSGGIKRHDMGDNFQIALFPLKDFSTRDKHARSFEDGPKLDVVKNFKDPYYEKHECAASLKV